MGALVNILSYSLGSIFCGILLTVVCMLLMFLLVKSWWKDAMLTPATYVSGAVLFFFLCFQSVLLCGAFTIKSYCSDVEDAINKLVEDLPEDMVFTCNDSQMILDNISQEWPLMGYYVNMADFRGHTPADIAKSMTDELNSFMNKFILRRLGWSLLFVIVGAFIAIKTISRRYQPHARHSRGARTGRTSDNRRAPMGNRGGRRMSRRR